MSQETKTVSDADALDQILLNLIMLDEAEQRGLSVTQEEVDAEMAGQRKNYEEYEEVRSYIEEWCTKMGITTEQYFDMVAEQLPRRMAAAETARYARAGILRAAWSGIYKGEPAGADDEICRSIPGASAGGGTARRSSITKPKRRPAMKRYYRKNRPSVALFLVSNLLAAGSSVFMSFLLGTFADSAMEGDLLARVENRACDAVLPLY